MSSSLDQLKATGTVSSPLPMVGDPEEPLLSWVLGTALWLH